MWWKGELAKRRKEVAALRARHEITYLEPPPAPTPSPKSPALDARTLAAAGFAALALVGPRRAIKLGMTAAAIIRGTSALTRAAATAGEALEHHARRASSNGVHHQSHQHK